MKDGERLEQALMRASAGSTEPRGAGEIVARAGRPDFVQYQLELAWRALSAGSPRAAGAALRVLQADDFQGNGRRAEGLLSVLRGSRSDDEIMAVVRLLLRLS